MRDVSRQVRACAPNKVALSDMISVEPDGMLLPTGFDTRGGTHMAAVQSKLDKFIKDEWRDKGEFIPIDPKVAVDIINTIETSLEFDETEFDWEAMRAIIDYYSDKENGGDGEINLIIETGRELTKAGSGDKSGRSIRGTKLRQHILGQPRSKPLLVLLQQEGGQNRGWTAHRFWWPIFVAPTDAEPCVFAKKTAA